VTTEEGREDRPGFQEQIDSLSGRVDSNHAELDRNRKEIDQLFEHVDLDRDMIHELHARGALNQEQVAQLERALITSRRIGAAVGILMAGRRIDEEAAFAILARASQNTNRRVRDIADDIVRTGDASDLPTP
jgi:hypothetical protein